MIKLSETSDFFLSSISLALLFWALVGCVSPVSSTHRGHLAGDKVAVLRQHVRHHECGQLWVGIRVDEPIVWQRVTEVACRVMLHQVKKRRLGMVRWSDGGDLIVFIPGSISTGGTTSSASTSTAACLTCVALRGDMEKKWGGIEHIKKYIY